MRALREIYRLLKPGGIPVFSSHNSWHPLVPLSVRDLDFALKDVYDLYLRKQNRGRAGSRYKFENGPLGDVGIYLSNPIHRWIQLRKCGYTPLDVLGKRDDILRFFERDPHYGAKSRCPFGTARPQQDRSPELTVGTVTMSGAPPR